ncbi:MAG: AAA family ATPase, partial [Myxococcales bacterium]|nr:AAA family ATPase [Myxococcales bacterium]
RTLAAIHEQRVIHRDIKPTNLLIDPESKRVSIADFGISVLLESERERINDPEIVEGTLPYLSPEQSGRTHREVDFRSDLYSLGVTFYELLTGRRPFNAGTPLELIHAHLARQPEPPQRLRPEIPTPLAAMVLELLAKAPERRYQTARGLAADLRQIRDLFELGGAGDASLSFVLGRDDLPRSLQLPHQLYGRAAERRELVDELERVIRGNVGRVMLLSGPAGVGKSALLADFDAVVAGFGGYLARGKFEAHRELPYAGFVSALAALVEQLLTESEERLQRWRQLLETNLGGIGRVVCELVPSLELVIGPQPALAELEPHEARNRIHLALSRFLASFCGDQPLVLVLDNLQWADASSLALLQALIEGGRPGSLLVLGAFRDGEVQPGHPLRQTIERLSELHRLRLTRLQPLASEAIEALLADTLGRSSADVHKLAQLIGRKTENNPLFVRQLLTSLAERRMLYPGHGGWSWDDEEIEAEPILDDALELMTGKLVGASDHARVLLARAACIGLDFDLAALEVLCERPRSELSPTLLELVDAGLLAHAGERLRFAHEGVQDAALRLLDDGRLRALHWTLGRWLLDRARSEGDGDELDERLFEIVDHLEAGAGELDAETRLELATLDLRAGLRSLGAAAYIPALRYLDAGIARIAALRDTVAIDGPAAAHYALVVDLHFARAQALALSERFEPAQRAFDTLLSWRLDLGRYARVATRRIRLLSLADQPNKAVALARRALERCGHAVPEAPGLPRMLWALVRAWQSIRKYDQAALMAMAVSNDERANAAMELLGAAKTAAYVVDSKLFVWLMALHIRLFAAHGFHPSAPLAMGQLAMGVGSGLRRVEDGIHICDQALALCERIPLSPARARVESAAYLFVWHLGRPFSEPLAGIDDAYQRALEAGDFEYAGYMGALGLTMHLEVGTHLRVVERLSRGLDDDLGRWGSQEMLLVNWMARCQVMVLSKAELDDDERTDLLNAVDPDYVREHGGSRVSIHAAIANRAMIRLLGGDEDEALALYLSIIDAAEEVFLASWMVPRIALLTAVAATIALESGRSQPPTVARALHRSQRIIERWAKGCPENYGHHRDLVRGLQATVRGRQHQAMAAMEQARVRAHRQGCRWVEGLAAERLAAVAEKLELAAFAEGARRRAWDAYEAWGAGLCLDRLRRRHPGQFDEAVPEPMSASDSGVVHGSVRQPSRTHSSSTSSSALDFESVIHSMRLISEELRLHEVIGRVLEAALANAGADHGALIIEQDGVLGVIALAGVDGHREFLDPPVRLSAAESLAPVALVNFVLRTEQALVIDDARSDNRFSADPYVERQGVLSLLGLPIIKGKRPLGALVLENRLSA